MIVQLTDVELFAVLQVKNCRNNTYLICRVIRMVHNGATAERFFRAIVDNMFIHYAGCALWHKNIPYCLLNSDGICDILRQPMTPNMWRRSGCMIPIDLIIINTMNSSVQPSNTRHIAQLLPRRFYIMRKTLLLVKHTVKHTATLTMHHVSVNNTFATANSLAGPH